MLLMMGAVRSGWWLVAVLIASPLVGGHTKGPPSGSLGGPFVVVGESPLCARGTRKRALRLAGQLALLAGDNGPKLGHGDVDRGGGRDGGQGSGHAAAGPGDVPRRDSLKGEDAAGAEF